MLPITILPKADATVYNRYRVQKDTKSAPATKPLVGCNPHCSNKSAYHTTPPTSNRSFLPTRLTSSSNTKTLNS